MKRRNFINNLALGAVGTLGFPTIVPAHVLGGKDAPSNKINIGQIGCGRIARTHDLPGTWKFEKARIMAVCDLDRHRTEETKQLVEEYYTKKTGQSNYIDVKMYDDYREMLLNKDIDAVMISTPDFWHAQPAMEAALAGKDIYLQKPTSLTIHEGRQLANVIKKTGRILQVGTQQRSTSQFRIAAELVRNGRIGKLHTVKVGLPGDPSGPPAPAMPVPKGFNYDMWLGSTPYIPYTEIAVHPQKGYDRPGWLRMEQFGAGMITGWGNIIMIQLHGEWIPSIRGPFQWRLWLNSLNQAYGMCMETLWRKRNMQTGLPCILRADSRTEFVMRDPRAGYLCRVGITRQRQVILHLRCVQRPWMHRIRRF